MWVWTALVPSALAVAPAPPDGLFLDISGVDHLWGDEPGVEEMARLAGTIGYEIVTRIGARVPRRYVP